MAGQLLIVSVVDTCIELWVGSISDYTIMHSWHETVHRARV